MAKKGMIYGILAYAMWGILPIYWKLLKSVGASEILVNRIIWSLAFLLIILAARRQWSWVRSVFAKKSTMAYLLTAAVLLSINWFIYIWAVNAGFVVETSLGYFINPLVNVVLGTVFLHERMRTGQWIAIGIAALGVVYLTASYGSLPWIALSLAILFGFYGLIKKKVSLGAAESLTAEMSILFIPAMGYLIFLERSGIAATANSNTLTTILLIGSGIVTATPLVLFAAAARRIPLSTMGVLQYIAPTMQFLIGIFIFGETLNIQSLLGFGIIWIALIIYSLEGVIQRRNRDLIPLENM